MDIKTLKPSERTVEIVFPGDKEPIGVRVTLMHVDDPRLKIVRRQIENEKIRLQQRGKFFKSEDEEKNLTDLIVGAMTGWEWYNPTGEVGKKGYDPDAQLKLNDEIPQFTKKNIIEVFELLPWFRMQLAEELNDGAAFFQR